MSALRIATFAVISALPATAAANPLVGPWAMQPAEEFGSVGPDELEEEPAAEEVADPPTEDRPVAKDPNAFARHGVGVRSGFAIIPTWILSPFLAAHANRLCLAGKITDFADSRGLLRQDGCNGFVHAQYDYRYNRLVNLRTSVGYQRIATPDGYWIDKDEWADDCMAHGTRSPTGGECDLAAADYTEVDMHAVRLQFDVLGMAPVFRNKHVEIDVGGGGGLGLAFIAGGIYQTPIGTISGTPNAGRCTNLESLKDFTQCRPRWNAVDNPGQPRPAELTAESTVAGAGADCTADSCNEEHLKLMGRESAAEVLPVYPYLNLNVSARAIIKDMVSINFDGGWDLGFYFAVGASYFFGAK